MAKDKARTSIDAGSIFAGLKELAEIKEPLMRRMGVAGGAVFRDEAKTRAPAKSGKLRNAIYLAYRDKESNEGHVVYSISWNATKAPHGHLLEFGHWRYNKIIKGKAQKSLRDGLRKGKGPQDHVGPGALKTRKWVAAEPFLSTAFDSSLNRARDRMLTVGREQFPVLMQGLKK